MDNRTDLPERPLKEKCMKKKKGFLAAVFMAAILLTGCGVKQISEAATVEAGQELKLKATDFFSIPEEKAGDIVFDTSKVDVAKPGVYEVSAYYKKNIYPIKLTVEDTTAPEVILKERYVFTNNAAALNPVQLLEGVYDAGGYSASMIRYERIGNLAVLDAASLKELTDRILISEKEEGLAVLGSAEIPEEEGIYRAVLAVTDESGNTKLEELCLILDKTGARIGDTPDQIIEVLSNELDKKPNVNPSAYHIFDNVDGVIPPESIACELERRDTEEPSYLVHVSYTDRAGNESRAEFLIVVKEKKAGEGAGGKEKRTGKEASIEGQNGMEKDGGNASAASVEEYGHTFATSADKETDSSLTSAQQSAVDAGYGVIIRTDGGYAVMVHGGEDGRILEDFLASIGCRAVHFGGSWICCEKNQYLWAASGIVPLITAEDPDFWD